MDEVAGCRYTFPCDDQALYTQDIPVTAEHQFEDATFALHRIALPMEAPILKHLVREACTDEEDSVCLCFEVFDCFEEDTCAQDAVCFKGTLSVKTILQTTKLNETMWEKVRFQVTTFIYIEPEPTKPAAHNEALCL